MEIISRDLINRIRFYIDDPYFKNRLIDKELPNWNKLTSALDSLEDSASISDFYMSNNFPDDLGGKYLFTYGLLQGVYVTQDSVKSIYSALFKKQLDFSKDFPGIQCARSIRDDILHATDRNYGKFAIFLIQRSLTKQNFEYIKETTQNGEFSIESVNIDHMLEQNNIDINKLLKLIVTNCEAELMEYKNKFKQEKMILIFSTATYAFEKIRENKYVKSAGYESLKNMITKYKAGICERYGSLDNSVSDKYIISKIEKSFNILDNELDNIAKIELRNSIEEICFDNLKYLFDELQTIAREHDEYFENGIEEM